MSHLLHARHQHICADISTFVLPLPLAAVYTLSLTGQDNNGISSHERGGERPDATSCWLLSCQPHQSATVAEVAVGLHRCTGSCQGLSHKSLSP